MLWNQNYYLRHCVESYYLKVIDTVYITSSIVHHDATSIDMHERSTERKGLSTGIVNQVACIKIIRI